ncbi:hypothetical protein HK405_015428, partial [Cladochytrium tenue]
MAAAATAGASMAGVATAGAATAGTIYDDGATAKNAAAEIVMNIGSDFNIDEKNSESRRSQHYEPKKMGELRKFAKNDAEEFPFDENLDEGRGKSDFWG